METRIALIGIIVENPESIEALNHLLHEYGKYIIGRMGIPYREREVNIISVAIDAPQDVINALSGKIGRLDGIGAKTVYSNIKGKNENKSDVPGKYYLATLQAQPARIRYAPSRCGLSPNKSNNKPCPFGIRYAASRASSNPLRFFSLLGCRPINIKREAIGIVNKFPIPMASLFIFTRLVAYPKYLSSNP